MPELSGGQLAAAIKAISSNTPMILLTGFGNLMEAAGEEPGGVALIPAKPFTRRALREALGQVIVLGWPVACVPTVFLH